MGTYVIDQNIMRRCPVESLCPSDPQADFVLPDISLVEMVKGSRWEDTMRGSLGWLKPVAHRTSLSMGVWEAIRTELDTGRPVDRISLLPTSFQPKLRLLVDALTDQAVGTPMQAHVIAEIKSFRQDLLTKEVNPVQAKSQTEQYVALAVQAMGPNVFKKMRSGRVSEDERFNLIRQAAHTAFLKVMSDNGKSDIDALAFLLKKPMLLRYVYLEVRHTFSWIAKGGLAGAKPDTVFNTMSDQQYVMIASFYDGLLSQDKGAADAERDLRALLAS